MTWHSSCGCLDAAYQDVVKTCAALVADDAVVAIADDLLELEHQEHTRLPIPIQLQSLVVAHVEKQLSFALFADQRDDSRIDQSWLDVLCSPVVLLKGKRAVLPVVVLDRRLQHDLLADSGRMPLLRHSASPSAVSERMATGLWKGKDQQGARDRLCSTSLSTHDMSPTSTRLCPFAKAIQLSASILTKLLAKSR
jgi:hypothetical protein